MACVHLSESAIAGHVYSLTGGKVDYLWDKGRAGFGVRTYPSGAKSYVVKLGRGPIRVVGAWPTFRLEEAWLAARRLQQQEVLGRVGLPQLVHSGPAEATPQTLEDLAREHHAWMVARRKPGAAADVWRRYRLALLPEWGARALVSLTAAELERWHQGQGRRKVWANRAMQTLRAGWNHAERWGWVPPGSNPLAHFAAWKWPEQPRQRVLEDHEATALHEALEALSRDERFRAGVACIRLLLLTGLRHQEAARLCWGEVHLERGALLIQDHKTSRTKGPKLVILGARAVALLRAQLRRPGVARVFPVGQALYRVWKAACELAAVHGVTVHDLRRTFATRLYEAGYDPSRIGRMVGDSSIRMVERTYIHPNAERTLRPVADAAGDLMSPHEPEPARLQTVVAH